MAYLFCHSFITFLKMRFPMYMIWSTYRMLALNIHVIIAHFPSSHSQQSASDEHTLIFQWNSSTIKNKIMLVSLFWHSQFPIWLRDNRLIWKLIEFAWLVFSALLIKAKHLIWNAEVNSVNVNCWPFPQQMVLLAST